jgi:hypothetical protein
MQCRNGGDMDESIPIQDLQAALNVLPDDVRAAIIEQARQAGVTPEQFVAQGIMKHLGDDAGPAAAAPDTAD